MECGLRFSLFSPKCFSSPTWGSCPHEEDLSSASSHLFPTGSWVGSPHWPWPPTRHRPLWRGAVHACGVPSSSLHAASRRRVWIGGEGACVPRAAGWSSLFKTPAPIRAPASAGPCLCVHHCGELWVVTLCSLPPGKAGWGWCGGWGGQGTSQSIQRAEMLFSELWPPDAKD